MTLSIAVALLIVTYSFDFGGNYVEKALPATYTSRNLFMVSQLVIYIAVNLAMLSNKVILTEGTPGPVRWVEIVLDPLFVIWRTSHEWQVIIGCFLLTFLALDFTLLAPLDSVWFNILRYLMNYFALCATASLYYKCKSKKNAMNWWQALLYPASWVFSIGWFIQETGLKMTARPAKAVV